MRSNFLKDFKLDMQWRTLKEPFRLKKCLMEYLLFSSLTEQSYLVNFKKIKQLWKPIQRCCRKMLTSGKYLYIKRLLGLNNLWGIPEP